MWTIKKSEFFFFHLSYFHIEMLNLNKKLCLVLILLDAAMIRSGKIFVATSCPFVSLCVVHDPVDGGAETSLAVVPVLAGAAQKVVVHAQVVAKLMSHVLDN